MKRDVFRVLSRKRSSNNSNNEAHFEPMGLERVVKQCFFEKAWGVSLLAPVAKGEAVEQQKQFTFHTHPTLPLPSFAGPLSRLAQSISVKGHL